MEASKAEMAHASRSAWAKSTPSVLYAPAVGWSRTVVNSSLIFSDSRSRARHELGKALAVAAVPWAIPGGLWVNARTALPSTTRRVILRRETRNAASGG